MLTFYNRSDSFPLGHGEGAVSSAYLPKGQAKATSCYL
jgi:hypothetical protein